MVVITYRLPADVTIQRGGSKKGGDEKEKGEGGKMHSTQYKLPCISNRGYTGSIPYI